MRKMTARGNDKILMLLDGLALVFIENLQFPECYSKEMLLWFTHQKNWTSM